MSNNKASLSQDLTRAVNLSLRPGRVTVLALGLLIGVAGAILFFWLGGLITARGLRWLSWIIQRTGAVLFAYVVLASMTSVVAMAHAESTGEKIGVPTGWALIARNLRAVVVGTIKPILVFMGLIAVVWLAGLLGLIPQVGPILWRIVSIVPLAAGLLAIFIIVKLFLVSFLFPAVLSVTKEKGTACYKESVRLIKGHAAHILGRIAVTILVCLIFYKVIVAGFALTPSHSSRTMGDNSVTLRGSVLLDYVAGVPGIRGTAPSGFNVQNPAAPFLNVSLLLPRGTRFVGGLVFSLVLIVVAVIIFSLPLLFFALSGYCAYQSFKDAPELVLKTEAVDWSGIKETVQEITGKRKSGSPEKPPEEGSG